MVNKDYILRLAERFGRFLAIIVGLRQANRNEDALIFIDDLFLQATGLNASLINSADEETLLKMISPLGVLNIEKCLWIAALLKEEGDIYQAMERENDSYYCYLKALYLLLEVPPEDNSIKDLDIASVIEELQHKLAVYELPEKLQMKLFHYFEQNGHYGKAEDILFELMSGDKPDTPLRREGIAFYSRLRQKSDDELLAGNLSRDEVEEGLAHLLEL